MFNRALVIGAGGTGGFLIPPLARLLRYHANGTANITVCDGDAFDSGNATRQLCGEAQLGMNKAEWIASLCQQQGLEIDALTAYLDKPAMRRFLRPSGAPLIIAAVDNDATRKLILDTLDEHSGDFFFCTPGNAGADDPAAAIKGNVLWWGRLQGEECGINPALVFPNIERPTDDAPREGSCTENAPSSPQLITANAMAATLTLAVIQNLLDGLLTTTSSCCFFNGRSLSLSHS